jgi:hypothetical protein
MAGFLYYVPGVHRLDRAQAAELGLGYAFDGAQISCTEVMSGGGPAKQAGVIAWLGAEPRVAWDPKSQTWQKDPNGRFWVGMETEKPPVPEDLARAATVAFYRPPLGDGNKWLVPTAILADGSCPLQKVRKVDEETGEIVARPEARFDTLRIYADEVREAIKQSLPLTIEQEMNICVEALQTNYRIGPIEASMLGILTDQAVNLIAWTLVDRMQWPDFVELAKA